MKPADQITVIGNWKCLLCLDTGIVLGTNDKCHWCFKLDSKGRQMEEQDSKPKRANGYMIGGNHYCKVPGEMLWDRIWRLNGSDKAYVFFTGTICSYIERYRDKNGIEDLRKAAHFLQKLIELEEGELAKVDDTSNSDSKENK